MTRSNLQAEHASRVLLLRLKLGFAAVIHNHIFLIVSILYWTIAIGLMALYHPSHPVGKIAWLVVSPLIFLVLAIAFLFALVVIATPRGAILMEHNLQQAGVTNAAGIPPTLLSLTQLDNTRTSAEFFSCGIPIEQFRDRKDLLESALNKKIVDIIDGKDRQSIMCTMIPAIKIPDFLSWSNNLVDPRDFVLVLGESLGGQVKIDLSNTPHILIGGSTGSGKTVLVKALIQQCLSKDADVYVIDLKGGLDYPASWKNRDCSFCDDPQAALSLLSHIIAELNHRKGLLGSLDCPNIHAYNSSSTVSDTDKLHRIVVVLDEIAELTDVSGLDKTHKELAQTTIAHLSTIARMGRAYGIHLIIGTQRPDAAVVPGQIKNNCDIRICGRADATLSTIILGNGDAADKIPKDSRGRFLMHDGTEFQGYWLDI